MSTSIFKPTEKHRKIWGQYLADKLTESAADVKYARAFLRHFLTTYDPPCDNGNLEHEIEIILDASCFPLSGNKECRDIAASIRAWILNEASGVFTTADILSRFCLSTKVHKKAVSEALRRFVDEQLIERYGKKYGQFRKVDRNFTITKVSQVKPQRLDIKLPFNMHNLCAVKPRNIILFQGDTGAGKTAILLNIAKLNFNGDMKVYYFSSETDEDELAELLAAEREGTNWDKLLFSDDFESFVDVIQPNHINIIDYLDLGKGVEEASEIIRTMNGVWEKLRKGIAFIAIQKKRGSDTGFGGGYIKNKPRIICNLDEQSDGWTKFKIIKSKAKGQYAKEKKIDPKGLCKMFKTDDGLNIATDGQPWRYR